MAVKPEGVGRDWMRRLRTDKLERLYIMYGEEAYRRETAISFIKNRLIPDSGFGWDFIELRGRDITLDKIDEAVSTPPVIAERKLVIVRDFDPVKNDISPLTETLGEDVCLIFDIDDPAWKPDKRTKVYKTVAQYGFFAEFNIATVEELEGFIKRCFSDRGHTINKLEIEYLIFYCTNLMGGLLNEIEKISAYAHGERITKQDIEAVASRNVESKIFEMCDALTANQTDRALELLLDLETSKEPAVAVTSVIARGFRQLYAARLALERGRDSGYIMQLLGIRYNFHASRLITGARQTPLPLLRDALTACMETDAELKSSRAADYDTVRMFIMRFAAMAAAV